MATSMTEQQQREIRDTAQRESWPYNDPRANYEAADTHRRNQDEGRERLP